MRWLLFLGFVWRTFAVILYWYDAAATMINTLSSNEAPLNYLNSSGVTFVGVIAVIGVVIYLVQSWRNRRAGIETRLMYQMLPPD